MEECNCFVYQNEIKKEYRKGYSIEFINPNEASSCVKNQLAYTSLIHLMDSIGHNAIVVEAKNPEKFIAILKELNKKWHTIDARITHFYPNKNQLSFIVGKRYVNANDTIFDNTFQPYQRIQLEKVQNEWREKSREINDAWPWQYNLTWKN